jgi:LppX_LprAFG lipoprotein
MRRGLLICAIAAASLATAACGGGGANALQSVASAAEKTAGTDSVRFDMKLSETVGPIGPLTFRADGVADNSAKAADMTMDLSTVAAFAGSQAGTPDQWKAHFILDDGIFYMHLPAIDKYLNGKTWVKADLNALAKRHGFDLSQLLQQAGSQDPTKALQAIESVGNVSKVGTATIDGVNTTEYSGTIDVQKAAAALGPSVSKLFAQAKLTTIPVDVWVGDDGLVRRLHENFAYPLQGAGELTTDLTMDLSDFGVQTNIQPPPAGETADISALRGVKS